MAKANLQKAHKRYKNFADKSQQEVKFEEGEEVWLNIKNFQLPESLSHKFLGPYVSPFKVLEKKFPDTYKLDLPENLRIHPIFHVSLLKPVSHDASRPNREHNSTPSPDLVHNEPKFEVEIVLKSRQLRGQEREYLVKSRQLRGRKREYLVKSRQLRGRKREYLVKSRQLRGQGREYLVKSRQLRGRGREYLVKSRQLKGREWEYLVKSRQLKGGEREYLVK
jgi:hypothetical protein